MYQVKRQILKNLTLTAPSQHTHTQTYDKHISITKLMQVSVRHDILHNHSSCKIQAKSMG